MRPEDLALALWLKVNELNWIDTTLRNCCVNKRKHKQTTKVDDYIRHQQRERNIKSKQVIISVSVSIRSSRRTVLYWWTVRVIGCFEQQQQQKKWRYTITIDGSIDGDGDDDHRPVLSFCFTVRLLLLLLNISFTSAINNGDSSKNNNNIHQYTAASAAALVNYYTASSSSSTRLKQTEAAVCNNNWNDMQVLLMRALPRCYWWRHDAVDNVWRHRNKLMTAINNVEPLIQWHRNLLCLYIGSSGGGSYKSSTTGFCATQQNQFDDDDGTAPPRHQS